MSTVPYSRWIETAVMVVIWATFWAVYLALPPTNLLALSALGLVAWGRECRPPAPVFMRTGAGFLAAWVVYAAIYWLLNRGRNPDERNER